MSISPEKDSLTKTCVIKMAPLFNIKETHTVYSSISFYNVNQKPMPPGTNFHCETTRSAYSSG